MSLFRNRKKFTVSERDPTYKVKYLGNVQTSMMKGDGCVDKPTAVLWNNYLKTVNAGIDMKLTFCASGLKAVTKEQGLTEYRAHRISYCIAHPKYPKLFIWVYRHEGKKLKVELRCHAVLVKSEEKAKAMAVQLHDKLAFALSEFMREKCRRQSSRLTLQRTNSLPLSNCGLAGVATRNKFLSTGQNFKPPVDRSASAPKLGSITEDLEPEELVEVMEEEEAEDEEDIDDEYMLMMSSIRRMRSQDSESLNAASPTGNPDYNEVGELTEGVFNLEMGNNIGELKQESGVQYQLNHVESDENDDDSSESGFSEQDTRENSSNGSGGSAYGSDPLLSTGSGGGEEGVQNGVGDGVTGDSLTGVTYSPSAVRTDVALIHAANTVAKSTDKNDNLALTNSAEHDRIVRISRH